MSFYDILGGNFGRNIGSQTCCNWTEISRVQIFFFFFSISCQKRYFLNKKSITSVKPNKNYFVTCPYFSITYKLFFKYN